MQDSAILYIVEVWSNIEQWNMTNYWERFGHFPVFFQFSRGSVESFLSLIVF
jgi:hypothetical protein